MLKRDIKIGDVFGCYTIISEPFIDGKYRKVNCQCLCGNIRKVHCGGLSRLNKCYDCRGKDLRKFHKGDKLGRLEIIEVYKNRKFKIKCYCGTIKVISSSYAKELKSCGCINHMTGKEHHSFKGNGDVTGTIFSQIKRNADIRNLEFDLDLDYISMLFDKQEKKCALTNLTIQIGNTKFETTASLDRIDNTKGYIKGNVWWLHKDVNRMKSDFGLDYFKKICMLITDNDNDNLYS